MKRDLEAVILMGPFGSGKSYLGHRLHANRIARYTELEPIVYGLFAKGGDLDVEQATKYIRAHYYEQLSTNRGFVAFESTGVVQRPLLLEVMEKYEIALIRICTPRAICLERVAHRNRSSKRPIELAKAEDFYDYWTTEIAPTYDFTLEVDGTNENAAIQAIKSLKDNYGY